jgi:two-component system cell cycle sensor histidine kinase/response regulator CckA
VGRLAGGVAHDFNNLLTVINGYSDLSARRVAEHSPLRRNLEEIRKAGERAASLTRQLLAFSRKQVLQPRLLSLNEVVTDMEKMLRRLIGEDIELLTVLEKELRRTEADPGQIEQVILNLAINARDAMPTGGKLIISTSNASLDDTYAARHVGVQPGAYVQLAVSDNGYGMTPDVQKKIFEPFFTTKEQGKGTGLGLATVYGIVTQSGGNIWVYSEPGRGTTFKIYLPASETEGEAARVEAREQSLALSGTETILLVEDDQTVRHMTREILEGYGYTVLDAASGGEAVRLYEAHAQTIHLLLTDVVMPQISGKELADAVTLVRPDVKVLFMSGYTDEAIVHHGVLDEGVAFIQKPFTPDALARKVRETLDTPPAAGRE